MRRWITALAVAGVAGLGLTGCAAPGGADGDLTDEWTAMAEPKSWLPTAGTCHPGRFTPIAPLDSYRPVDCATSHLVETAHVGTFTGPAAERTNPPPRGSVQIQAAYAECDARVREYLGDDWRTGRIWLGVVLPTPSAWTSGARWFRCDLTEQDSVEDNAFDALRKASLKGALKAPGPLSLGCYAATRDSGGNTIDTMPAAECRARHDTEFVGVWQVPASVTARPTRDRDWLPFYNGCFGVAAKYVGVPESTIRFRIGIVALPGDVEDWKAGNRGVRCYVWSADATFTRSLKGVGDKGLPIRTG